MEEKMFQLPMTLGVVALLALGGAGVAASTTSGADNGGLACGVSTQTAGGMLTLEGVVQSPEAISGEYRFALKSSGGGGSTNINQGGQFSATAGMPVSLGKVTVNAGANIDLDFNVTFGGRKYDCSQQFAALT
jgi:hypothetical protein